MKNWILADSQKFWRTWGLILAIGFVFMVLSLFFVDQEWANFFGSPAMEKVWLFHRNITEIGRADAYLVLAVLGLLMKPVRKKAAFALASMLSSGLILHVFKFLLGRERPHKTPDHNPFVFEPFNLHHHFQSFPSGHSQTLFCVATIISFYFPKTTPWILTIALYLASTRATTLAHFVSDVFAGALIGILVSACTLRFLVRKYGT